ncbi:MAG: hypothetical protein IEMM0002_0646 [bacterium]|nr:MAG: hypothetical protein IEMM0002_0646 [bacterium]
MKNDSGYCEDDFETVIPIGNQTESKVIAVSGTGGGVGKSSIVALAAASLARRGRKVLIIDLNCGSSPLCRMLGMRSPAASLRGFLGDGKKLMSQTAQTPIANLSFLHNGSIPSGRYERRLKSAGFFSRIRGLDFNVILLDVGLITDRVKMDYFALADHRLIVASPDDNGLDGIGKLVPLSLVGFFENSAWWKNSSRRTAGAVINKLVKNPENSISGMETIIEKTYPDMLEGWRRAAGKFSVELLINKIGYGEQLEKQKALVSGLLETIPCGKVKTYFLPAYRFVDDGVPGSLLDGNGFRSAMEAVVLDLLDIDTLGETKEKEIFSSAFRGSPENELQRELEARKQREEDRMEREIELIRQEKYESICMRLDQNIAERRKAAIKEREAEFAVFRKDQDRRLGNAKQEKIAHLNRQVEMRRAELFAQLAEETERKTSVMEQEIASRRDVCLGEMDGELEKYFRNQKITLDKEILQLRRRKEADIEEELLIGIKKDRTRKELELAGEVDKIREMIWQQLEEKRLSKLILIDDSISQYRQEKKKEVEKECRIKREFLDNRNREDASLLRENMVMEIFRDIMEISALFDTEDYDRKIRLVQRIDRETRTAMETRKKNLNVEMARYKEGKEKELLEEVHKLKEERRATFAKELDGLREKMKVQIVEETQEIRRKLLEEIEDDVNKRRIELLNVVEMETQEERAKRQTDLEKEIAARENALQNEMRVRITAEEKRLSGVVDEIFNSKKREKEKILEDIVKDERKKRVQELNESLTRHRHYMMENIDNEMHLVREQHMEKLRVELSTLREEKLKQLDKDMQEEIRRKTEAVSVSLNDMKVSMRAEMQEKIAHEEIRLRKAMNVGLQTEVNELRRRVKSDLNDQEIRLKTEMKTSIDEIKKKRIENFDRDLDLRRSKHEEYLNESKEKEKVRLIRELMSRLNDEEQVHRELMYSRIEYEQKKLDDEMDLRRKKAEDKEKRKLYGWIQQKKEEAVSKVRAVIKNEHQKRMCDMRETLGEERSRKLAELSHETRLDRRRYVAELDGEMQKRKAGMIAELDSEIDEMKRRKREELERYIDEETNLMEKNLDGRYKELVIKKEEWLKFDTRRKLLQMNESIEKEIEAEKEKQMQKRLVDMELEIATLRRKNKAAMEEEKLKMLVFLREETISRRNRMIRKMSVDVNKKLKVRRSEVERDIEHYRHRRKNMLEKEFARERQKMLKKFERELELEHDRRLDNINAGLKAEEAERRQEIIEVMFKKKAELDRFYELERRKYYERLQSELVRNKEISTEHIEDELSRLKNTWRLN